MLEHDGNGYILALLTDYVSGDASVTYEMLRHPQTIPWPGLDNKRKLLAVVALGMLILTFVAAPFQQTVWR